MVKAKLIVFVGPLGCGKTTQAFLLSREYDAKVVEAIPYTILHSWGLKFINSLARATGKTVIIRFYEDEPPSASASPEFLKRIMPLFVLLHILGLFLNWVWLKLKTLRIQNPIIEDEGFVYKHVADLLYIVKWSRASVKSSLLRLFMRLALGLTSKCKCTIVFFRITSYDELKNRYIRQKVYNKRRKIEPWSYVAFQLAIYKVLGYSCVVNSSDDWRKVYEKVKKCLKLQ